jgi:hypothetical protein
MTEREFEEFEWCSVTCETEAEADALFAAGLSDQDALSETQFTGKVVCQECCERLSECPCDERGCVRADAVFDVGTAEKARKGHACFRTPEGVVYLCCAWRHDET